MPRAVKPTSRYHYDIPVRNEVTGVRERFKGVVSPHLRKIGAPYRQKIPYYPPVNTSVNEDYLAQCIADTRQHIQHLQNLAALTQEQQRLERLTISQAPSPPIKPKQLRLIDRVAHAPPMPDIHFRKSKIILREKEYTDMIDATDKRLKLIREDDRERPEKSLDNMAILFKNFDTLKDSYHQKTDKLTNRQWRLLKRDLKAVKRIDLEGKWENICMEIAALGNQRRFVLD